MIEKTSRISLRLLVGYVTIDLLCSSTNGNLSGHRNTPEHSAESAFD